MIENTAAPIRPTPLPGATLQQTLGLVATLAAAVLLATVFRIVAWQPFTIPSASMEPGLLVGDYVIVSKFAYGWSGASLPGGRPGEPGRFMGRSPRRGDVVVFRLPRDPAQIWVKRVIGLPGDAVQMRDGAVFINGQSVGRTPVRLTHEDMNPARQVAEYVETLPGGRRHSSYDGGANLPGDNTPVIHVPQGQYLMMGDNRDNSLDGRWPASVGVGLLPEQNILGRVDLIAASWKPGASLFKPWTWPNLRWGRFLTPIR